jgi:hypothetical protein
VSKAVYQITGDSIVCGHCNFKQIFYKETGSILPGGHARDCCAFKKKSLSYKFIEAGLYDGTTSADKLAAIATAHFAELGRG